MATTATESEASRRRGGGQSPDLVAGFTREKTNPDTPALEEAPEGGARAWLVATGSFAVTFCCMGFANSFGTFEEYYASHQLRGRSADDIAWIGSLSAFLQFAAGMIGGPLFDRFGAQVIRPAAAAYVFAMMMLSLCKEYWQIMLVQGVLMGVVMGFLQFPALAAVSQYFVRKRAAALGVAISGSSVGGIVIPIALAKMLNSSSLAFGWSVRVIGFLIMPFMAFADVKYLLLVFSLFFMFVGMFTPFFFLPTYAVTRGMDPTLGGYLLAILNAASTFGRVIPGVLADKYGRVNMFTLGGLVTGIVIFCMNSATSNATLIVYAAAFGFSSGTIISGGSAALTLCPKDPRDMGTYLGMGLSISALGSLIGPPVSGAFVEQYGGFFQVSMFGGAMCLLGGCLALVTKLTTPQGILGRV